MITALVCLSSALTVAVAWDWALDGPRWLPRRRFYFDRTTGALLCVVRLPRLTAHAVAVVVSTVRPVWFD